MDIEDVPEDYANFSLIPNDEQDGVDLAMIVRVSQMIMPGEIFILPMGKARSAILTSMLYLAAAKDALDIIEADIRDGLTPLEAIEAQKRRATSDLN